jgi:hypothetical protein
MEFLRARWNSQDERLWRLHRTMSVFNTNDHEFKNSQNKKKTAFPSWCLRPYLENTRHKKKGWWRPWVQAPVPKIKIKKKKRVRNDTSKQCGKEESKLWRGLGLWLRGESLAQHVGLMWGWGWGRKLCIWDPGFILSFYLKVLGSELGLALARQMLYC